MKNDHEIRKNGEGYNDPTAFLGIQAVIRRENDQQKRLNTLIFVVKFIVETAGYDLLNRIEVKDRKTGKEYR